MRIQKGRIIHDFCERGSTLHCLVATVELGIGVPIPDVNMVLLPQSCTEIFLHWTQMQHPPSFRVGEETSGQNLRFEKSLKRGLARYITLLLQLLAKQEAAVYLISMGLDEYNMDWLPRTNYHRTHYEAPDSYT